MPILLYSFIVGSRYGWGVDYMHYKEKFHFVFIDTGEQIGFSLLNKFISILGLNYVGAFITYSLIFITCAFILIKSYGQYSKYMYAFLIPATLMFSTTIIRQAIGLSFVFLGIYFLDKRKWVGLAISVLIAASIHFVSLVTVFGIGVTYLLFKKPISWKILVPGYVFFAFFYNMQFTAGISKYLQIFNLQNQFQQYLNNAERSFGADAINSIYTQSTFALILSVLFHISIIYLGYLSLKIVPNKRITYIFNAMALGLLLYRAVFQFELLRRFAKPLEMLYFIVLGYIVYVFANNIIREGNRKYSTVSINFTGIQYAIGLILIMSYLILYFGRFTFLNPEALFFWNSHL
ncbi:MAG: EpsG family protein [Cyclobacteriaceae bacterium]|nr:EpsG family protein [Cyclobacteriaceae bacterium]